MISMDAFYMSKDERYFTIYNIILIMLHILSHLPNHGCELNSNCLSAMVHTCVDVQGLSVAFVVRSKACGSTKRCWAGMRSSSS